ncbi:SirB2 family protein [Pontibacter sp. BT310]|uniref:SirB2 family protein n=1 Tax=Pontibacter populi TaxID=890055 RepID=A0ABS6XFK9_9BACT|nr:MULTISPECIES: SirB2 family protein [Pontibacter]MBJ6119931.1 SirB2 family protein [Pontibacter sp. BT310]MBR0572360.1 SirB2 family protein [Microvirga sp. STS03]MBW3366784.1 SirB2 family protein [Pontibacter populi]
MPVTAFLHTHILVVILFLLLFIIKTGLLLLNKRGALTRLRNKTKVAEMILGTLILVTGGWLLFNYSGIPGWLITKVFLVLIAIPVGIVGLKRENKVLAVMALLFFVYVYSIAETDSLAMQKETPENTIIVTPPETAIADTTEAAASTPATAPADIVASLNQTALTNGQTIFVQQCATCHGEDGAKELSGAANLIQSQLNLTDRKQVIAKGRGLMPAFGEQLSEQELEEVAAYTMTFKK